MDFINSWMQGIIFSVLIATILEMILPKGNNKKYIKMIIGIFIVYNIISPVILKFTGNSIDIGKITDFDKILSQTKKYEMNLNDIDKQYNNNIEEVYILNLKKDIKSKIEEKGYMVNTIKIELDNTQNYEVNKLTLTIHKKENKEEYNDDNKNNNINKIEKIENVNIDINANDNQIQDNLKTIQNEKYSALDKKEISDITEFINSTYQINKDKIFINN